MIEPDWPAFVSALAGRDTGQRIAERTGIAASNISRWLSGQVIPQPSHATAFARAYDVHPLTALVAAGYVTEDELDTLLEPPRLLTVREFTSSELAEELSCRAANGTLYDAAPVG
jgi:transcriptional regulator with XRE-family HTH domain